MTETQVREWLMAYAYVEDTPEDKAAVVDCIMHQDGWSYTDTLADQFAGAQFEPGPEALSEGVQFALSALYECHTGPHTAECPTWDARIERGEKL